MKSPTTSEVLCGLPKNKQSIGHTRCPHRTRKRGKAGMHSLFAHQTVCTAKNPGWTGTIGDNLLGEAAWKALSLPNVGAGLGIIGVLGMTTFSSVSGNIRLAAGPGLCWCSRPRTESTALRSTWVASGRRKGIEAAMIPACNST